MAAEEISTGNAGGETDVLQSLMLEGDNYQKNCDFLQAIQCYDTVIERDPLNAGAHHKRGWSKAHLGDIQGELEDWTKAVELDPGFAQAFADRSIARVTLKDSEGALSDMNTALELNPGLKKLLEPVIGRMKRQVETVKQRPKEDSIIVKGAVDKDVDQLMGDNRREFLKQIALVGAASVTLTLPGCSPSSVPDEKSNIRWGMFIDLKRCVGCRACTIACKAENHTPPGVAYNVVLEYESGTYPHTKRTFLPRPCMHCEDSSCTLVCPVSATFHREDGVVVVDYDKCIGCRYCIAACPYGARSFDYGYNYSSELSNPWEQQASPEYGQNRKREEHKSPVGNVRKCTFCLHRITNGLPPACSATCMGNAIHFGDLADPEAKCMAHNENLQELLATRSYFRLKEEIGNKPRVYYLT